MVAQGRKPGADAGRGDRSSPGRSSRSTPAERSSLGIRPESLEDASLAPDIPKDRHIKGVLVLREPLGSEIIAHFEVDAPPALTEDVRELARDVGHEGTVQAPAEGDTQDDAGRAVRPSLARQERRRDRRRSRHERGAPVRRRDRAQAFTTRRVRRRQRSLGKELEDEIPITLSGAGHRAGIRSGRLRRRRRATTAEAPAGTRTSAARSR